MSFFHTNCIYWKQVKFPTQHSERVNQEAHSQLSTFKTALAYLLSVQYLPIAITHIPYFIFNDLFHSVKINKQICFQNALLQGWGA